jgi:hypothetical protein
MGSSSVRSEIEPSAVLSFLRTSLLAAAVLCFAAAMADLLWMEGFTRLDWRQARQARGDRMWRPIELSQLFQAFVKDEDPYVNALRRRFMRGVVIWNGLVILGAVFLVIRDRV